MFCVLARDGVVLHFEELLSNNMSEYNESDEPENIVI